MSLWSWIRGALSPKVVFETQYWYNGRPATPEQQIEIEKAMLDMKKQMDEAMIEMREAFRGRS